MDFIRKNARVLLALLLLSVGLGATYHFWYQVYEPRKALVDERERRLNTLQASNRETRAVLGRLGVDSLRAAIETGNRQIEQLERILPPQVDIAVIHDEITRRAAERCVWINRVRPLRTEQVNVPVQDGSTRAFSTHGFNLQVQGRYHDVAAFLNDMLLLDRITRLRNVQLNAGPLSVPPSSPCAGPGDVEYSGGQARSGDVGVQADIDVVTYTSSEGRSAAPANRPNS